MIVRSLCPGFSRHARERHQLDFTTPGSLPWEAKFRKQILQTPNLRMKARGLPHMGHRLYLLTLNLGFRAAFIISDFFAKTPSLP